ncbi:MAG: DDE-type integrase/transposase/recombinase [Pusillimonas sp.]
MLVKEQLVALFDKLGTPANGQALVRKARIESPVREVQSRGRNVVTIFASQKMGCEIRTESRHIEFPAALNHEHDRAVLEFYPQPCTLHLELVEEVTGEVHYIHHTPDFLVIRDTGITLEEWKSDDKLAKLAERYPYRYKRGPDGNWCAPQIEEQLADLGITYRIRTEHAIPRLRVENLLHLADYQLPSAEPCSHEELKRLESALQKEGMLFLADLTSLPYSFNADFLFKAIADGLVVTDLDTERLGDQRRCRLYRDPTFMEFTQQQFPQEDPLGIHNFLLVLEQGTRFRYHDRELEVVLIDKQGVLCRADSGETVPITRKWLLQAHADKQITVTKSANATSLDLARYSDEELAQALKRFAMVEADDDSVSERTRRDWRKRINEAAANGANPVIALIKRTSAKGNRSARFSDEQESLLQQVITDYWRTSEAINYTTLYKRVCTEFAEANLTPPSQPTVIKRIKAQADTEDVRVRHGKRRAYHQDEFVDVLYADTPTHGSRAFQYVHIDHTQLDIELISHRTGKPLGRPWLTFAIDAFTRRIVGLYLTFDPPSYVSVMMVMRDIVKRFQRLPEMIVVDNGRDLTSGAFRAFLQVTGVHLRLRPAGQPRAGAVMERVFGTAHSQYVHNLAGNTKATKNVRMTTGKHLPVKLAQWTLESMYHGLTYWATEYYDTQQHPSLGCSPREAFERSLAQNGQRAHRNVVWNQDFLIATCPPANREAARQVHNQRGVKVHDRYYWHSAFRHPKVAGQKLPVRVDPWDASTVYVRVNEEWAAAKCRSLVGLGQLTDVECRAISEEYRQQAPSKSLNDPHAPQRLREFMQVFKPEGALALALERQQENKSLYNELGLSAITPVAPVQDRMLVEDQQMASINQDDPTLTPDLPTSEPHFVEPANVPGALDIPEFDDF